MSNIRIKLSCNIPRPVCNCTAPDIILGRTLAATQKGGPNQSLLVKNSVTVGHRKISDLFAEYYTSYHKSEKTDEYLNDSDGMFECIFLLAYTPQLNPIEVL